MNAVAGRVRVNAANAWRWAFAVTGVASVARVAVVGFLPLSGDEAYHWLWSKHLDWSYHEHPPLLAWSIAAATALLGDTRLAVRLPSILAAALLSWALYRYGADRLRDPVAGAWAVCLATATPVAFFGSGYASTDLPFLSLYVAALWALAGPGRARDLALFGAFLGLALLSKLIALFLVPGAVLALALSERRARLRRPAFWAALGLAALLFSPVVAWNAARGWPTIGIRLGHQVGGQAFPGQYLLELIGQEIGAFGVLIFFGMLACVPDRVRRWVRERRLADAVLLVPAALLVVAYTAKASYSRVAFHWLAAGFAPLALPLAQRWRARPRLRGAALALGVALGITPLVFVVEPALIPPDLAYPLRPGRLSTQRARRELIDLRELGDRIRRELDAAPGRVFLFADSYGSLSRWQFAAGAGSFPSMLRGVPDRSGGSFADWMAEAEPRLIGADALYVVSDRISRDGTLRRSPDDARDRARWRAARHFERVEALPDVVIRANGEELRRFFLIRCYAYRGGLADA